MRLIDADALIPIMKYTTTDNEIGVFPIRIGFDAIKGVIDDAPTIDAVEVVRCRECKYNPWKPTETAECVWDDDWAEREQTLDDFCSYGVREDGEK